MKMHHPPHPGEVVRQLSLERSESWLNQRVQYDLWHAEKLLRVETLT